jgi:hypothetical protein
VSNEPVVCAKTAIGNIWYVTIKAKGKAVPCVKPGAIRKKSNIVWVCGVVKKKKLWRATQPLPPAVVASATVIEPGASQPSPALDSTQVATPVAPVVADNTVLADTKIPDDKIVTQVINDVSTPAATVAGSNTTTSTTVVAATKSTVATSTTTTSTTTSTTVALTCATGGNCKVGDMGPGGGTVFYDAGTTQSWGRYLEAAPSAAITVGTFTWGCSGTTISGADGKGIGTGKQNTTDIVNGCNTPGIAARLADDLDLGGKTDWFLPSRDELYSMWNQRRTIGGFASYYYWSSSESDADRAWAQYESGSTYVKSDAIYVRPVRAF